MSAPIRSAIYRGKVAHARHAPRPHRFSYRLFQLYLDLDELPTLFRGAWLWSYERFNIASFRRRHFHGDPDVPLKEAVRARVEAETGTTPPDGPVTVLTSIGYLGYCFNPVSFYYLFEEDGTTLHAVMAEITNTPWNERHQYVLCASNGVAAGEWEEWLFSKDFHVSPFFGMDHRYRWRFQAPSAETGSSLGVAMDNLIPPSGDRVFDASMHLERHEFSRRELRRCLFRHPFMTGKVTLAIYWQALRLWLKRTPVFDHPKGA